MDSGEGTDRRRNRTRKVVTVEEDAVERSGVKELSGYGTVEVVVVEVESPEKDQSSELRRDIPPEILAGDGDSDDARVREAGNVHAGNAGPVAWSWVVLVPVGEGFTGRLLIDGGFE